MNKAKYHLPGLFEFNDFYKEFLPIYGAHREYFYDWCEISSIYGAPGDCIWSGGRFGYGEEEATTVLHLLEKYDISARLTFSNSLLRDEHLTDKKCNELCRIFEGGKVRNGVIVHSDLLTNYLKVSFPGLYLVSSTTKVITDFDEFKEELDRDEFEYVVPDFRLNNKLDKLKGLTKDSKDKVEFLCNECCYIHCVDRKACYESVSRRVLSEDVPDHICNAPDAEDGYLFSKAMESPAFIGVDDIRDTYLPNGFTNFKIEGRNLGSALLFEFILHYMVKPKYHLRIRELTYLDSMLNLF